MGKGKDGRNEKRGGKRGRGREGKKGREGWPPLSEILNTPLVIAYFVFEFCEASASDTPRA